MVSNCLQRQMLFTSEETQFFKLGLLSSVQRVTDAIRVLGRNVILPETFFLRALVKTREQAVSEAYTSLSLVQAVLCGVCLPTAILRTRCSYKCVTQL